MKVTAGYNIAVYGDCWINGIDPGSSRDERPQWAGRIWKRIYVRGVVLGGTEMKANLTLQKRRSRPSSDEWHKQAQVSAWNTSCPGRRAGNSSEIFKNFKIVTGSYQWKCLKGVNGVIRSMSSGWPLIHSLNKYLLRAWYVLGTAVWICWCQVNWDMDLSLEERECRR